MQTKSFYTNCRNQGAQGLTLEATQQLRDDWFNMWPEMNQYVHPLFDREVTVDEDGKPLDDDQMIDMLFSQSDSYDLEGGELNDLTLDELKAEMKVSMARRYKAFNLAGMWRMNATKQAALNFPFQSLAGVITKVAAWLVFLDSQERGYKIVNYIHDELIVEVEEERGHEIAHRIQELMLKAGKIILPNMRMAAEPAMMRRWSKAAEAVYDENGILICWEDRPKKSA